MNYEKYINKMDSPVRPKKPFLAHRASSKEVREYAILLEQYENSLLAYKNFEQAYRKEDARLIELFKEDLFKEYRVKDSVKAEKIYSKAWEEGHSDGLSQVEWHFEDIIAFVRDLGCDI